MIHLPVCYQTMVQVVNNINDYMDNFENFYDTLDSNIFIDNKTYKNLSYFWDKIQNQLIYLWDADERSK